MFYFLLPPPHGVTTHLPRCSNALPATARGARRTRAARPRLLEIIFPFPVGCIYPSERKFPRLVSGFKSREATSQVLVARRSKTWQQGRESWEPKETCVDKQAHSRVAWSPYYIIFSLSPLPMHRHRLPSFPIFFVPLLLSSPIQDRDRAYTVTSRDTRAWYKVLCHGSCRCDWHQRAWLGRRSKETEWVLLQESR